MRQQVTVPLRILVPFPTGTSDFDITVSRLCEQGFVTNVYGYNSATLWANMRNNWEFFFVKGVTIEWNPSNLMAVQISGSLDDPKSMCNPFLITDDPDTYSQVGQPTEQKLMKPSFRMMPFFRPWKIQRNNAALYQQGKISPGDTTATDPMYS